eukprot:525624_1
MSAFITGFMLSLVVVSKETHSDFDCLFAMETQPFFAKGQLQDIADALQYIEILSWNDLTDDDSTSSIFVDFINGNYENNGSIFYSIKQNMAKIFIKESF